MSTYVAALLLNRRVEMWTNTINSRSPVRKSTTIEDGTHRAWYGSGNTIVYVRMVIQQPMFAVLCLNIITTTNLLAKIVSISCVIAREFAANQRTCGYRVATTGASDRYRVYTLATYVLRTRLTLLPSYKLASQMIQQQQQQLEYHLKQHHRRRFIQNQTHRHRTLTQVVLWDQIWRMIWTWLTNLLIIIIIIRNPRHRMCCRQNDSASKPVTTTMMTRHTLINYDALKRGWSMDYRVRRRRRMFHQKKVYVFAIKITSVTFS